MSKASQFISCTLRQILFSPKGHIEGFLASHEGKQIQVVVPPHIGEEIARGKKIGQRLYVRASPDKSPKSKKAAHPVFEFESFLSRDGKSPRVTEAESTTIKGIVAQIHYAKHGEPNGVILKSGEFIHLRPHGMAALDLALGAKVSALGQRRTTLLGLVLLEAVEANGVEIE